jgi:HAD superfamily hydrolase (TIGR01484 family)
LKNLIVFDLDGTLAESKSAVDAEMASLIVGLLAVVKVAVISGGAWSQIDDQVVGPLSATSGHARFSALSLLPTCGTKFYRYDSAWVQLYSEDFSPAERDKIMRAFDDVIETPRLDTPRIWGEQIDDRGSQITFSALGQAAPLAEKTLWDPDRRRRLALKALLDDRIPEFDVNLGGTTSIDVTRHGINKAYGIQKLREILGIGIDRMLFIGDALYPDGNDFPVKATGVDAIQVRDPHETKRVVEAINPYDDGRPAE